jgi:hypothetical protein
MNKLKHVSFDGLYNYVKTELAVMFRKLSTESEIHVFADYRYAKDFGIYSDINMNIPHDERLNAIPMIKRKYICELYKAVMAADGGNSECDPHDILTKSVRCMYELKSLYGMCGASPGEQPVLRKYVNLHYLSNMIDRGCETSFGTTSSLSQLSHPLTEQQRNNMKNIIRELIHIGVYRYFVLRGLKLTSRKTHCARTYALFHNDDKVVGNITRSVYNSILAGRPKLQKLNEYIPFSVITYCLPKLIADIDNPKVSYYGCVIESDFALSNYIHTYSKNSFPSIYSCDTDMICLLCDVPSAIKIDYYYFNGGNRVRESYIINPVTFWFDIFGFVMNPVLIRTLCVLLGTDYNPYNSASPIHIKNFDKLLKRMNLQSFQELTVDNVDEYLSSIMKDNPDNKYCSQTALALSLYNHNHENRIMPIKPVNINTSRFLEYIRSCIIEER